MAYLYNLYGWYSGEATGARTTEVAPSNLSVAETPGQLRANWTGHEWLELQYVVPVEGDVKLVIKQQIWEEIKKIRDTLVFGGVYVSNKWIHTDTFSRTQWLGMMQLGGSVPEIQWKTMDGSFVTTTPALVQAVFQAILVADSAIFQNAEVHRLAMEASNDPENYDFSTGWPAAYQP